MYVCKNRLYRWPFQVACLNLKTLSKCRYSTKLKCQATTQSPFTRVMNPIHGLHHVLGGYTCPVSYVCYDLFTIVGIAMKSAILLENLTTLAKKCLHPPTSNSRPAVPSIKSRIYNGSKTGTRKNLKSPNYTSWCCHEICKSVAAGNIMAI